MSCSKRVICSPFPSLHPPEPKHQQKTRADPNTATKEPSIHRDGICRLSCIAPPAQLSPESPCERTTVSGCVGSCRVRVLYMNASCRPGRSGGGDAIAAAAAAAAAAAVLLLPHGGRSGSQAGLLKRLIYCPSCPAVSLWGLAAL